MLCIILLHSNEKDNLLNKDNLSAKDLKKLESMNKKGNRKRVSKFRSAKKDSGDKLIQFYIKPSSKLILDDYKDLHGESNSEVFEELISITLKRRLKNNKD